MASPSHHWRFRMSSFQSEFQLRGGEQRRLTYIRHESDGLLFGIHPGEVCLEGKSCEKESVFFSTLKKKKNPCDVTHTFFGVCSYSAPPTLTERTKKTMALIRKVPYSPTLRFYRTALRVTRLTPPNLQGGLALQLGHLQRKLRYNIRDGISIYQHERDTNTIGNLIRGGEHDIAMIQAWKTVDPHWLESIFKKPTPKK